MSWQPNTFNKAQREERRLEGGRLLLQGKISQADIARHLGVSQVAVAKWKQQLLAHNNDLKSLQATTAQGLPSQLTAKQWQQIKRIIRSGALASGFATERWTLPRIQQTVEKQFGVRYSTSWLSIRLRALGLSVQRPVSKARKKDDALAEAWLRSDWQTIKKSVRTWRRHYVR